jgi:MYXO-CTERM domain-containing protein
MRVRTPRSIRRTVLASAAASACLLAASASVSLAEVRTFDIDANGAKEVNMAGVPNQGDPDGTAVGTISLDNGTGSGTTGSATFNITLANLDPGTVNPTGHHIHQAPATTTGPIVIDFGDPDTIRNGNTLSGTITGLPAATITNVFNNPTGFYYNFHNATFPAGAVRDQLPEPGAMGLLAVAAVGMLRRRRARQN